MSDNNAMINAVDIQMMIEIFICAAFICSCWHFYNVAASMQYGICTMLHNEPWKRRASYGEKLRGRGK